MNIIFGDIITREIVFDWETICEGAENEGLAHYIGEKFVSEVVETIVFGDQHTITYNVSINVNQKEWEEEKRVQIIETTIQWINEEILPHIEKTIEDLKKELEDNKNDWEMETIEFQQDEIKKFENYRVEHEKRLKSLK